MSGEILKEQLSNVNYNFSVGVIDNLDLGELEF